MDKAKVDDCVALINEHPKGRQKPPKRKPIKKQEKVKVRFIVAPEESPPVDETQKAKAQSIAAPVDEIHADLSEHAREKAYRRFVKAREELSTLKYLYDFKDDA